MSVENQLLNEFTALYQNQEYLANLLNASLLQTTGISDLHCLAVIGDHLVVNGVQIAQKLKMTRSGTSKIIQRLQQKKLILSHQKENNKKEIYHTLTATGKALYEQHQKAHKQWIERDFNFLQTVPNAEKEIILAFLQNFNQYLAQKTKEAPC